MPKRQYTAGLPDNGQPAVLLWELIKITYRIKGLITIIALLSLVGFLGCTGSVIRTTDSPKTLRLPIIVWLEMPANVRLGETVPMELKVKNISSQSVEIEFGPDTEFVVTTRFGKKIWNRFHGGGVISAYAVRRTLDSGEEMENEAKMEMETKWNQMDNTGQSIRPGTYFVRGIFGVTVKFREPEGRVAVDLNLETKPVRLVVR